MKKKMLKIQSPSLRRPALALLVKSPVGLIANRAGREGRHSYGHGHNILSA